jgi:hypothetical protein
MLFAGYFGKNCLVFPAYLVADRSTKVKWSLIDLNKNAFRRNGYEEKAN